MSYNDAENVPYIPPRVNPIFGNISKQYNFFFYSEETLKLLWAILYIKPKSFNTEFYNFPNLFF